MIIRIVLGFVAFELIAMLIVLIGLKRRNQRKIFWSIAIVMFIGALLAIATGAVKLVHEDLTHNHLGIAGIFMAIIFAGVNVYIAEKLHKLEPKFKEREEALQAKATASEQEVPIVDASAQEEIIEDSKPEPQIEPEEPTIDEPKAVVLSQRLDTPRVEYSITEFGKTLLPHVLSLIRWGQENFNQIMQNRAKNKNLLLTWTKYSNCLSNVCPGVVRFAFDSLRWCGLLG
jgi:hypothetical protein